MRIKPLGNRVVVLAADKAVKSQGGIDLPQTGSGAPQEGEVLAIGEDVKVVSKGDLVVYTRYAGSEIIVDGTKYLVLDSKDILGVKT